MSHNIDYTTFLDDNVVIIPNTNSLTYSLEYFQGNFSRTFTIPQSGQWLLLDMWTGVFNRKYNGINNLQIKIDTVTRLQYYYMSEESDLNWGTTRRTLTGTSMVVTLPAGQHSISTSGNLYPDSTYGPSNHYIVLIRIV